MYYHNALYNSVPGLYKKSQYFFVFYRATRILNADFINSYKPLMFFFLYISYYSVYFYSNLYYKHK